MTKKLKFKFNEKGEKKKTKLLYSKSKNSFKLVECHNRQDNKIKDEK